jgi:L-iditol 2-dehydrogenase
MKAAVLYAPGDIRVEEVPAPVITGAGEVLLRVEACGVCGSDIPRMLTKGAHVMPLICGHEFSARVTDASDDVEGVSVGSLVTVPPLIPCFKCRACLRGTFSLCEDYDYFGSRRNGAYAEYVVAPLHSILAVPDNVGPVAAAMVDPAAIALHALRRTRLGIGSRVAVVGLGPIGLFAIQWARLAGASEVVAVDISDEKLALALTAGASDVARDLDSALALADGGFDVVFEGAGVPAAENIAARLAGPQSEAVFVGIPHSDVNIQADVFAHFLRQEVTLHGAWNSFSAPWPGDEWRETLDMMSHGRLQWEFMVTHDLSLEELPEMFRKFGDRSEHSAKVIFRPNGN